MFGSDASVCFLVNGKMKICHNLLPLLYNAYICLAFETSAPPTNSTIHYCDFSPVQCYHVFRKCFVLIWLFLPDGQVYLISPCDWIYDRSIEICLIISFLALMSHNIKLRLGATIVSQISMCDVWWMTKWPRLEQIIKYRYIKTFQIIHDKLCTIWVNRLKKHFFPCTAEEIFFLPVWTRWCVSSWCFRLNFLGQCWHW